MLSKQQKKPTLIDKIKKVSVSKKAFLYVFFMGITGAIIGTVDSQIAIKQCVDSKNCEIENPTEMQINKIGVGACVGMFAATALSLPALSKEED